MLVHLLYHIFVLDKVGIKSQVFVASSHTTHNRDQPQHGSDTKKKVYVGLNAVFKLKAILISTAPSILFFSVQPITKQSVPSKAKDLEMEFIMELSRCGQSIKGKIIKQLKEELKHYPTTQGFSKVNNLLNFFLLSFFLL